MIVLDMNDLSPERIKFTTQIDFGELKFNNCLMYLEPRLQEYVKKKEYYSRNSIDPSISLESQYQITDMDLKRIDSILKNKDKPNCGVQILADVPQSRGIVRCGNYQSRRYTIQEGNERFTLQPRKQQANKSLVPQNEEKNNIASCAGINRQCVYEQNVPMPVRFSDPQLQEMHWNKISMNNSRNDIKYNNAFSQDNFNNHDSVYYKKDPQADWKQVSQQKPMKYRVGCAWNDSCIGNNLQQRSINQHDIDADSYLRPSYVDLDTTGFSRESNMDLCYKVNIPGGRNNSCYTDEYLNTGFYLAVPYMGSGHGQGDICVESDMRSGELTRFKNKKTGGYLLDRFEELDRDIQDPQHIVLPFPRGGIDARAIDKWTKKDAQYII